MRRHVWISCRVSSLNVCRIVTVKSTHDPPRRRHHRLDIIGSTACRSSKTTGPSNRRGTPAGSADGLNATTADHSATPSAAQLNAAGPLATSLRSPPRGRKAGRRAAADGIGVSFRTRSTAKSSRPRDRGKVPGCAARPGD